MSKQDRASPEYWADWLLDAVAGATQDRRFLKGHPDEDRIAIDAIYVNAKKAMENLLKAQ